MTVDGGYGCGIAYISPHMNTNILVFGAKKRNIVISMHLNDKNIDKQCRMSYFYINFAI